MEYRNLGDSDIQVSRICLGSMTWGEQNTEAEAHAQLDFALDHEVNFVDTAEMYAVPPRAETYGLTESYIGSWFAKRGLRDRVVLATKVAGRGSRLSWIRGGTQLLDRPNILAAIEESLRRLRTDYIDLYQLHWPDRITNYFGQLNYPHVDKDEGAPISETVGALGELLRQGKIRSYGLSNETPWGVHRFLTEAQRQGVSPPVSIQNPYSLLNRAFEVGLSEFSHRAGVGLLAYSPLAFGVLTGKYEGQAAPPGARLTLFGSHFKRYTNPQALAAAAEYVALARRYQISPAQLALAFVNSRPFVTSNIIGATNLDQLRENVDSPGVTLSKEMIKEIERIFALYPNPAP